MGIHDRDYYRREGPSFLGSLADQGRVTTWLIGLTVLCFIFQILTRQGPAAYGHSAFTEGLILDVNKVVYEGQVWRLVTYAFLHDDTNIWHIAFNMLVLFWFGRQVEDVVGGREYLVFYLCAAAVSGLAYVLASFAGLHGAWLPTGEEGRLVLHSRALGASGAVTAALVLAAMYNPRQVIYLFFVIPVPIWGFVVLMVAVDAFNLLGQTKNGVATSAHLGGAAFGFLYYKLHWRLSGWTYWLSGGRAGAARKGRPRLRIFEVDDEAPIDRAPSRSAAGSSSSPSASPSSPAAVTTKQPTSAVTTGLADEHLEAQVDTILEKIQRVGMEGLTESEKQTLLRASEELKRRRNR